MEFPNKKHKKMKPLISIIIPTYKRPELLARTLQSVDFSKRNLLEIIVVDDDPNMTGQKVAQSFENVIYIAKRGTQRGLSKSRNIGIDLSIGEFLIFIDDDDYFEPKAIDYYIEATTLNKGFVYSDFNYIKPNEIIRVNLEKRALRALLVHNFIPVGSYMIRRSAIKYRFDEFMRSHEDWDFLLKNLDIENSIYIPKITVNIDKTADDNGSMQNRRKQLLWMDFISIYSRHPASDLAELRSRTLKSYGINISAEAFNFNDVH